MGVSSQFRVPYRFTAGVTATGTHSTGGLKNTRVGMDVAGKWWKWRFDQIPKVDDQITEDVKITTLWSDFPIESKWFDQIP
jgi:hypothetical protein